MIEEIEIHDFIEKAKAFPIIDVRSPGEYAQGHILQATNLPLFNDEERAKVGTAYVKIGKEVALQEGLMIAKPKMKYFIDQAKMIAGKSNTLLVHCWRGGLRSKNMAWLFDTAGIKTYVLKGGYKSYRRYIREYVAKPANIIILGGMTGSGKTEMLDHIKMQGQQVIDLEGIAHHKGSAFGSIGQLTQPTNEQFENNIFNVWKTFNLSKTIWIEDESYSIGSNYVPLPLFQQMQQATLIEVKLSKEIRIQRLINEYAQFPSKILKETILKIQQRLGGLDTKLALEALEKNNFAQVANIMLTYYDKAYSFCIAKRDKTKIHELALNSNDMKENAKKVLTYYNDHLNK